MDHQRHRAPEPHPRRPMVLAGLVGLAVGAAVVGGSWWLVSNGGSPHVPGATPAPATSSAAVAEGSGDRSAEARNQIVVPTAAPLRSDATSTDPVLLLGDSLAVGISPYVDAGLGERLLTVDAAEGRNTATSVSLLEPYASTAPPVWVVSLGTNDNIDEFEEQARSVMELAGPQRCVVWFDVWRDATDASINPVLEQLAEDQPNLHLIPWHDTSEAHPEWFSGTDVHPSTVGYAVRGQMAMDALSQYCE